MSSGHWSWGAAVWFGVAGTIATAIVSVFYFLPSSVPPPNIALFGIGSAVWLGGRLGPRIMTAGRAGRWWYPPVMGGVASLLALVLACLLAALWSGTVLLATGRFSEIPNTLGWTGVTFLYAVPLASWLLFLVGAFTGWLLGYLSQKARRLTTTVGGSVVFVLVMVSIWARWFRVEDEAIRFAATWQYVAPQTQTNPARLGEVRLDFVDYPGHFVGCYCPELVDYLRQWPEPQVPVAYQVRWRGQRVENAYVTGIGNFPHPFKLTLHSGTNGTLAQGPIESLRRR